MKFGYKKLNITPTKPVKMAGFSRQGLSNDILDPIEINTIAINENNQTIIISILDSIIIEDSVIQPVKNYISKKYNIPLSQIIIGCIHTHSAPAYFKPFFENVDIEVELQTNLIEQFIETIESSLNNLEECQMKIEQCNIEGLYGNRNTKDGYSDKSFTALHFTKKSESTPCFSLLSMACHPTILDGNNLKLSADLFGFIRKKYKDKYGNECMVINGCCGDVSTRFYREASGIKELDRVSNEIMKQLDSLTSLQYLPGKIQSSSVINEFMLDARTQSFTQNSISHLNKELDNPKTKPYATMLLNALNKKVDVSPITLKLTSNINIIGQIIIVSMPGDITAILGKRIKDAFLDHLVIIVAYCENYSNYFVCEEDYGKYFETYISRLDKGAADTFVMNIIHEIRNIIQ